MNVLALQQGQYTTIGILTQCERTGTATRTVHNDWDTHPVQTYWHCNKASTQRLGYSPSTNVLALQQGQCTTWDTHPVRTYWHCNKASVQRSAAWWRRCCSKERACHPSSATCLYNTACTDACYSRYLWQAKTCRQFLAG